MTLGPKLELCDFDLCIVIDGNVRLESKTGMPMKLSCFSDFAKEGFARVVLRFL